MIFSVEVLFMFACKPIHIRYFFVMYCIISYTRVHYFELICMICAGSSIRIICPTKFTSGKWGVTIDTRTDQRAQQGCSTRNVKTLAALKHANEIGNHPA